MASPFTIGVGLGDPATIAVVERQADTYKVGYLRRLAVHEPYPAIVAEVIKLRNQLKPALYDRFPDKFPRHRGPGVIIDISTVGESVFDLFRGRGFAPIGIMLTTSVEYRDGALQMLPRAALASNLKALMHRG